MLITQHPQGLVCEILGEVVALIGGIGRFDEAVVFDQMGYQLLVSPPRKP